MTKKKQKFDFKRLKQALPYIITAAVTLTLVFVGSLDKKDAVTSINIESIASNNYDISVDQMYEYYTIANVSDALSLASATDVASIYVTMRSMYDSGIVSSGKTEKPVLPNITVTLGVITYIVQDGDTMESIAAKYGLSTDQIRWSNGLKTTAVSEGGTLYLPSRAGIVYTVKSGDTLDSIASRYGSTVAEIIALNNLEVSGISEGMKIAIAGGTLPETERPEYVAPVVHYYTYYGSSSSRDVIRQYRQSGLGGNGNPMVAGQCTWFAWWWRYNYGPSYGLAQLPAEASKFKWCSGGRCTSGDAKNWDALSQYDYTVNSTPAPGTVFIDKTRSWYGHVGIVLEVMGDGRLHTVEMNYSGTYMVTEAYINADAWSRFLFVH
ncbi:LysM peptidoglycan-binding domain-containing protein [Candidatus Saccharibacteria bacterium]|nr:LysM peptidoglycan-binding domain-containing protein [Candidatus Saccharibacteria bacterium]